MASLLEQIYAVSPRRETKADVVDYYRETYRGRGQNGWKQRLVNDLSGLTGMKPKNLEKRFDPQRIHNAERRNAAQYQEMGDRLPPMAPDGGYHIHGTVWVKFSDGECEEREVDEYIRGKDAKALLKMSADVAYQSVINNYMSQGDMYDEYHAARIGECQEPDLHVDPIY